MIFDAHHVQFFLDQAGFPVKNPHPANTSPTARDEASCNIKMVDAKGLTSCRIRSWSAVQDFMGVRTAEPWNGHALFHDAFFTKRAPSNIVSGEIKHQLFNGFFFSAGQIAFYPQKQTTPSDVCFFIPVCEQSVMANPHEVRGNGVKKKSSDELHGIEGFIFNGVRFSVAVAKRDLAVLAGKNSMIGNGHPVGVSGNVT